MTLGLTCLGWLLWVWVKDRILKNVQLSLVAKSQLVAEMVGNQPDSGLLQNHVGRWGRAAELRITLIADDGTVLADSMQSPAVMSNHLDRTEIQQAAVSGMGQTTRYSQTMDQSMMYLARKSDTPPVRFVRVALPLGKIEQDMRWLSGLVVSAVGLTLTGTLLLSVLIAKRISSTLERDHQELQAVLASMVEGVLVVDCEQRARFFNGAALRMLDLPESSRGKPIGELTNHTQLLDAVQAALHSDEPCHREISWNFPEPKVMMAHAARLHGVSPLGAVLVLHDVTTLRHLERMRRDFVANVSHELKTPLAAIKATVETLLAGALDDAEHRSRFVRRIQESADRLHRLVLDLLSLGRIESGREQYEIHPIDVLDAVQACLARHEQLAFGRQVNLTMAESAPDSCVLADEEALAQILDNLVDNAVKYTSSGGKVSVSWHLHDGLVDIKVSDTGIGIAEKELSRIFERFYRVDRARSRELGGTGLGLSIVKHLAHALGGSVRAHSQPNVGSVFIVSLPVA